jgi:hypothetical protein
MVAAGIAAKNEKILPYLAAGSNLTRSEKADVQMVGVRYGYSFMEKFIQIPFRIPRPDEREITRWVASLTNAGSGQPNTVSPQLAPTIDLRKGFDPVEFEQVVETVAQLFQFNPRRLKQFVNVFRLRLMIALMTGVFTPARSGGAGAPPVGVITIHKVGLLTAILMRWSQLANDLAERPSLLDELLMDDGVVQSGVVGKWAKDTGLLTAIKMDGDYSLSKIDLRPLLLIMPDSYSGSLGARDATQERTQLIARQFGRNAPSTDANTSPSVLDIPTRPEGPSGASALTRGNATAPTGPTGSTGTIIVGSDPTPFSTISSSTSR